MCLYLKNIDYKAEKKIADHDIICYKIINGTTYPHGEGYYNNYAKRELVGYKNSDLPRSKDTEDEDLPQWILDNPDEATFFHTPFQTTPIEFGVRLYDNVILDGGASKNIYKYYGDEPLSEEDKQYMEDNIWLFDGDEDMKNHRIAHSLITSGVFHSVATLLDARELLSNDDYYLDNGDFVGIAKCIIPKGAEYYEGVFESTGIPSYGSREIIYQGIVELEEC